MFPRHPSHPPITEPTIALSIVATSKQAAGSCSRRVNPSIESEALGGVTPAFCQNERIAEMSFSRARRMISGDIVSSLSITSRVRVRQSSANESLIDNSRGSVLLYEPLREYRKRRRLGCQSTKPIVQGECDTGSLLGGCLRAS